MKIQLSLVSYNRTPQAIAMKQTDGTWFHVVPSKIKSRVVRRVGWELFSEPTRHAINSFRLWTVAAYMGDEKAKYLCSLVAYTLQHTPSIDVAPSDFRLCQQYFEAQDDWITSTLKAEIRHSKGRMEDAQIAARLALDAKVPGQKEMVLPEKPTMPWILPPAPWSTLAWTCRPQDASTRQYAFRIGATVWNDPEACALHSLSEDVQPGTDHWLEYVTKAAMAGHVKSMQDLGKYHLAIHGWFPLRRQMFWEKPRSWLGFHWLRLSTMLEQPLHEACIWAGLAIVLRQSGQLDEGQNMLRQGREQIVRKGNSSNVSDDEQKEALREIDGLLNAWDVSRLVTWTNNFTQCTVDAEYFLGKPIMPIPG